MKRYERIVDWYYVQLELERLKEQNKFLIDKVTKLEKNSSNLVSCLKSKIKKSPSSIDEQ